VTVEQSGPLCVPDGLTQGTSAADRVTGQAIIVASMCNDQLPGQLRLAGFIDHTHDACDDGQVAQQSLESSGDFLVPITFSETRLVVGYIGRNLLQHEAQSEVLLRPGQSSD
jgi:hypothetical protein